MDDALTPLDVVVELLYGPDPLDPETRRRMARTIRWVQNDVRDEPQARERE